MQPLIEVRRYQTHDGYIPFRDWIARLDARTADRIRSYLDRLERGNWGNSLPVGHGVSELKLDFGPGYRVYYVRDGLMVVILLCGGDKASQQSDIERAHRYAADYWSRR